MREYRRLIERKGKKFERITYNFNKIKASVEREIGEIPYSKQNIHDIIYKVNGKRVYFFILDINNGYFCYYDYDMTSDSGGSKTYRRPAPAKTLPGDGTGKR